MDTQALTAHTATAATAPAAPIILVTTGHPTLHKHPGPDGEAVHPRLGRLLQPRHTSSVELTAAAGIPWACDNDCFQGLDEVAFVRMLDRITGLPGCLFVTVPDVVGEAAATLESFDRWAPELERRELPLGLVAQDGMTVAELEERAPRLAALFIGGSTEWKEGEEAAELAIAAKRLGLWVHWGRVNTRRRFDLIVKTGAADSFDGSKWARFRNTYLDAGLEWLVEAAANRRAAIAAGAPPITAQAQEAPMPDTHTDETRRRAADYTILEAFDVARHALGHDYGGGQRRRELARLDRATPNDLGAIALLTVWPNGANVDVLEKIAGDTPRFTAEELADAFDRVATPKRRRLERESYRAQTPATARTLRAWAIVAGRFERAEVTA